MWILDTDHVSLLFQGHPGVVRRLAAIDPREVAIAIVTAEEQLRGRFNVIRRATDPKQLVLAYQRLHDTLDDLNQFTILDFSQAAAAQYADLLRQKIRIGTQDLRIAAIALAAQSTLVTRNQRDFSQVPSLPIVDWTLA